MAKVPAGMWTSFRPMEFTNSRGFPPVEEIEEEVEGIGHIDRSVVVQVGGIVARKPAGVFEEEVPQKTDDIIEVPHCVPVDIAPQEGLIALRAGGEADPGKDYRDQELAGSHSPGFLGV
jgi:hypothetical protein